jgi:hypothetical protein
MVERLERSELDTITLQNNDVHWHEKNKEIIVNSMLFDVHQYHVGEDSTVFTGLFDTNETELKKQVKKLFERRDENNAPRELIIAKLILQLWIAGSEDGNLSVPNTALENKKQITRPGSLLTANILVPFPPPRV